MMQETAGGGADPAPRLAIKRVHGCDGQVDIQVVHSFRAHLRQGKLAQHAPGGGTVGSLAASSEPPSAASAPPSAWTRSSSDASGAGVSGAAAPAGAAAAVVQHHCEGSPSSSGTPSMRDPSCRSLLAEAPSSQGAPSAAAAPPRQPSQPLQPPPSQPSQPCSAGQLAAEAAADAEEAAADAEEAAALAAEEAAGAGALAPYEVDAQDILIGERIAVGGFAEVFAGRYMVSLIDGTVHEAQLRAGRH